MSRMDDRASARIRGFGTSVFTEMSRLAREHGADSFGWLRSQAATPGPRAGSWRRA
jgi:hypothetical protein